MKTRVLFLLVLLLSSMQTMQAKVARVEILSRSDVLDGKPFGLAGSYEKLVGKVYFTVDPANPQNRRIVDLDKAPRDAGGLVGFSADLYILRPKNAQRGNETALLEISNRGGKGMVRYFNRAAGSANPTSEAEFGDGFLMRQGFTLVWIGWQFDVPDEAGNLRLYAPVATENGRPITGWVRSDFVFTRQVFETTLGHRGQKAQPAIELDNPAYKLTVRDTVLGPRREIPRGDWKFGRSVNGTFTEDPTFLYYKNGFEPGKIYEVVYRTQDPTVVGLGLASVRDLVSHLKYDAGAPASVKQAIGFGISQSGRFLRHFLYQGFNADEAGRQVFDGVNAHVAGGGHGSFNHRFAEPSRDGSPFSTFFYPTDIFPFTDAVQTDPETGRTDGILTLTARQKVMPKIFYTNSSYEYWGRAASLIHTTIDGAADMEPMDNVRIYYFTGGQHGIGPFPPRKNQTQHPTTTVDYSWSMRALLLALTNWVREGATPPESRFPRLADGSLAPPSRVKFPALRGVTLPTTNKGAWRVDYGPEFEAKGLIASEPPVVGKPFPVLVPQVDDDGIDLGGIRMPEVAVPLATFTGWNPRDPRFGAPEQLIDFAGSYLPLAMTRAEREKAGDRRLSIEERYTSRDQYLGRIAEATLKLVKDGYLLAQDAPPVIQRAGEHWDWAVKK